ncbi:hypothetical protein TPHA_0G01290 [Tetrapisispora phaffii CBS 4417]|uniref:Rhodanese domain-containing protein n=1 Tax=Tetrapisispora phaffii (strain ATCC 24235 / CBS 4417 / NBRC 1672 / NRRL Y-8282 / UCD 70-5) TaxID=1071381 RepID=G8BVN8_TETPH|nr:hypothetical protein TPHA_0G01290 [Tetrapisispora phaffii CBS 4417]CCE63966.1 hypothetical protein TPHA_0G01290 [Tetrapisispora phaffii CBS 4417]
MWKAIVDSWNGNHQAVPQSAPIPGNTYDFDDMKALVAKHDPSVVLVDNREPSEYEVVHIPGSINIPYKSHPNGFALDGNAFQATFGVPKPDPKKELVFFCASGFRAGKSREVAYENGYKNTSIYPGSTNDWVSNGGDKLNL